MLTRDYPLQFKRNGSIYTYYGYDTPPSGHYVGIRTHGVNRYIPLIAGGGGRIIL